MATQLFVQTAQTAAISGVINNIPGVQNQGVIGFSGITPGTNNTNAVNGQPYGGFQFIRYIAGGGPANGTTVVDIVFPRGRDDLAASYAVVYTVTAGALT